MARGSSDLPKAPRVLLLWLCLLGVLPDATFLQASLQESLEVKSVAAEALQDVSLECSPCEHVPAWHDIFTNIPNDRVRFGEAMLVMGAKIYPEVWSIRPVVYTLVGILGVCTVNTWIHWCSDYPLGLASGYSFGMLAAHSTGMNVASTGKHDSVKLSLGPELELQGPGIQFSLRF